MVLGSTESHDALVEGAALVGDDLGDRGGSNKGDGGHCRVLNQGVAAVSGAVDELEDSRGESGPDDELANRVHGEGNLL